MAQQLLDGWDDDQPGPLYRDPNQAATASPGQIPDALREFVEAALQRLLRDREAIDCAIGEVLTEPKRGVWFDPPAASGAAPTPNRVALDIRRPHAL